jgi:hypothetical protein
MAEVHRPHAHASLEAPETHHEESDVNIAAILAFAGSLVTLGIVISLVVLGLYRLLDASEARQEQPVFPLAAQQESRLPPEPRLQTNPREDLEAMRRQEQETLTTYGWVDRNAGTVRIPIDQAMKLTIERGLPVRK